MFRPFFSNLKIFNFSLEKISQRYRDLHLLSTDFFYDKITQKIYYYNTQRGVNYRIPIQIIRTFRTLGISMYASLTEI